ncbi:MAG: enoyl-CoA hydratase/isomerase family protein [Deferribacteres bacterium]|nr:enoyl-CoA hydratase/isomerase family protein [Deferribacteres bacterium]
MSTVRIEIEPPIGWLIFNRPEVRNAFNVEMWKTVPEKALELDKNDDVKIIIMRGEGNCFGAGADIKELLEYAEKGKAQEYAEAVKYCFSNLARINKIMIAAIERYALGGGCMVAASCDLRVAEKGAKIGIPLVKLGLAVEPLGIKRLIELVGGSFAMDFLLTGDPIPEEKLLVSGFVNFMVEKGEAVSFSKELARRLLDHGPYALKVTKMIYKQYLSGEADERFIRRAFASCMETSSFKERARRFINKT